METGFFYHFSIYYSATSFSPHPHFKNSGIALPQVNTSW